MEIDFQSLFKFSIKSNFWQVTYVIFAKHLTIMQKGGIIEPPLDPPLVGNIQLQNSGVRPWKS